MRPMSISTGFGLIAVCLIGLTGCGKGKTAASADGEPKVAHSHSHHHDHGHGPHGGQIVGFDTEKYHAELTHDEATHRVGIYLLGDDAATAAPIEAESVTIEASVDDQPTQYTLPAVAQPGEAAGKSSFFELVSEPLQAIVSGQSQSTNSEAQLNISIEGKPYVGMINTKLEYDHAAAHSHSHGDDDTLVWLKEISDEGYDIALGHHGVLLLAGADVEPAVQVTREGKPVADAQVFNALLAGDGQSVLAEEVVTIYEPPTSDEPAHYAQGGLKIPPGTREATIRFRIVLPEGKGERTFDVPVAVK